jgi:hypothetical protein
MALQFQEAPTFDGHRHATPLGLVVQRLVIWLLTFCPLGLVRSTEIHASAGSASPQRVQREPWVEIHFPQRAQRECAQRNAEKIQNKKDTADAPSVPRHRKIPHKSAVYFISDDLREVHFLLCLFREFSLPARSPNFRGEGTARTMHFSFNSA